MRQRVMIAMSLVTNPDLLLADEPTTALDVTVQARILEILRELRDDLGIAVLFVTHDLGVVANVADRVVVMYQGKIVEQGEVRDIFQNPSHPYVKGLLACRPTLDTKYRILPTVEDFITTEEGEGGTPILSERPDATERLATLEKEQSSDNRAEDSPEVLLEVKGLSVHFHSGGRLLQPPPRDSHCGGRGRPRHPQGPHSRPRGGIGMRQNHARTRHPPPPATKLGFRTI